MVFGMTNFTIVHVAIGPIAVLTGPIAVTRFRP